MTLNLPRHDFNVKVTPQGNRVIFDRLRRRFVTLSPEEWVRQNFVEFLIDASINPNIDKSQLESLIKLNWFKSFGTNGKYFKKVESVIFKLPLTNIISFIMAMNSETCDEGIWR